MTQNNTKTKYYKVLREDGSAPYQTSFKWPLPKGRKPGDWVSVQGPVQLCGNGLHLCAREDISRWVRDDNEKFRVFEAEGEGAVQIGADKVSFERARLVREVSVRALITEWVREGKGYINLLAKHPKAPPGMVATLFKKAPENFRDYLGMGNCPANILQKIYDRLAKNPLTSNGFDEEASRTHYYVKIAKHKNCPPDLRAQLENIPEIAADSKSPKVVAKVARQLLKKQGNFWDVTYRNLVRRVIMNKACTNKTLMMLRDGFKDAQFSIGAHSVLHARLHSKEIAYRTHGAIASHMDLALAT
jgi:hypothetical protein